MESCIFCKIIKNELPSAKVWEDKNFLAFLTIQPINPGHTLVIPKKHIDYIFGMDDLLLGDLMIACKPLACAIAKAFHPVTGKVGVMVAGLAVSHAHVHLIPMNAERDLDFSKAHNVPFASIQENAEKMKLHGLTPVVSSPFSADSAEAAIRIHPRQRRGFLRRRIKKQLRQ